MHESSNRVRRRGTNRPDFVPPQCPKCHGEHFGAATNQDANGKLMVKVVCQTQGCDWEYRLKPGEELSYDCPDCRRRYSIVAEA